MVDEKIIEAFHMMWDNFPGAVRLIHIKDCDEVYVHLTIDTNMA